MFVEARATEKDHVSHLVSEGLEIFLDRTRYIEIKAEQKRTGSYHFLSLVQTRTLPGYSFYSATDYTRPVPSLF
jgi:hypothetical protein